MSSQRTDDGHERRRARARSGAAARAGTVPALLGVLLLVGCYDQVLVPDSASDGRLTVTNDEEALGERVSYPDSDVPIDPTQPPAGTAAAPPALAPSAINLRLLVEAAPPTVNGQLVQATSVWMTGVLSAVVSYNMRGAAALGGLDYFTGLALLRPRLRSSLQLVDADVSAVSLDGVWAYAATSTSDPTFASPAVLERIEVRSSRFWLDNASRVPLSSFAATSTLSTGSVVYATSGDGGGVFAFDASDLSPLGEYPLDDARWVAWDEDGGRVVVAQGTPGRLALFAEGSFPGGSMTLLNTFPFPGADVAESKSTVEVVGRKAFVAAGPEGVQVVCLDDGQVVGNVPIPDPASLGLDPSVVVTNSVTVEDDLMFISNGEAGVYAAAAEERFADSACDAPQQITVLGRLRLDDLESANHVVLRGSLLFVAAGLGGLKVVWVRVTR